MSLENLDPLDSGLVYELFVLGLLEPEEMAAVRTALEAGEPETVKGIQKASLLASSLAYVAPEAAPPKAMRRRLMLAAGAKERGFGWSWIAGLTAVCAALLVITFNIRQDVARRETQLAELRQKLGDSEKLVAQAKDLYDFLRQPSTIQVRFGDGQAVPPRGQVFLNRERGVLLFAGNLPNLAAGKIYQMWYVPKQGAPIPAGVFRGENGQGVHFRPGAVDPAGIAAIAVTVEPEAGSATPTMPILFAAPVQAE